MFKVESKLKIIIGFFLIISLVIYEKYNEEPSKEDKLIKIYNEDKIYCIEDKNIEVSVADYDLKTYGFFVKENNKYYFQNKNKPELKIKMKNCSSEKILSKPIPKVKR